MGNNNKSRIILFWAFTKNLRVRLKLASHRPSRIFSIPTRYGKVFLRDNFGDITNLPGLWMDNEYGMYALKSEGVVIDVGANIGLFSKLTAHFNPGRPIHCFEPLQENIHLIRKNCPGAIINSYPLGAKSDKIAMSVDAHGVMASSIDTTWKTYRREFTTKCLDDYVEKENITFVSFLKMDTEGMEVAILQGAMRTLGITGEIVMETHGKQRHEQCYQILTDAGFTITRNNFDGKTGMLAGKKPTETSLK